MWDGVKIVDEDSVTKVCDIVNACYREENDKNFGDRPYIRTAMNGYRDLVRIKFFLYAIDSQLDDNHDDVNYVDHYPAYTSTVGTVLNQLKSVSLTVDQKEALMKSSGLWGKDGTFEYPEGNPIISAAEGKIKFINDGIEAVADGGFAESGYSSASILGQEYEKGDRMAIQIYFTQEKVEDDKSRLLTNDLDINELTSKWQYILATKGLGI